MEDLLNNTWTVTIVGGIVSTVVGGVMVALIDGTKSTGGFSLDDIDVGGCLVVFLYLLIFGVVMAIVSAMAAIGYPVILGVLLLFAKTFEHISFLNAAPWESLFTFLAMAITAGLWLYLAIMIFAGLVGNRQ